MPDAPRIVFLHGLESGPHGRKYQALAARFREVEAPDTTGIYDLETRVRVALDHLGGTPATLVGSSFGGLVALMVLAREPDLVQGMVLAAPAVPLADPGQGHHILEQQRSSQRHTTVSEPLRLAIEHLWEHHDELSRELEKAGSFLRKIEHGVRVIHGRRDELVPADACVEYFRRWGVPVTLVDDDHPLTNSLDLLVGLVEEVVDSQNNTLAGPMEP